MSGAEEWCVPVYACVWLSDRTYLWLLEGEGKSETSVSLPLSLPLLHEPNSSVLIKFHL